MSFKDELEDRIGREIFTKTLNDLIKRTGFSFREIANDLSIPESTLFDLRMGSKTSNYPRLAKMVEYFKYVLQDDSVTLNFLLLGSDKVRVELESRIDKIKAQMEKEQAAAAWHIIELKQQLSLFSEDE
jgi:predicted transcriptional regulator